MPEKRDSRWRASRLNWMEKFGGNFDDARWWGVRAWQIASLMVKGAYLLGERRRLFGKLGEEVYYRIQKGEWQNPELDPLIRQLDRLNKKVELEEMLIRNLRFSGSLRNNEASFSEKQEPSA